MYRSSLYSTAKEHCFFKHQFVVNETAAPSFCAPAYLFVQAQTKSLKKSAPLAEAAPEQAGVSKERLARIDSMCAQAVAKGAVPGVVALVARNGKIVYHKAFGMADNESGRPLKRDAIFRIASQTKAVTATAVMMLWEEGRFRLDDPVWKYLPEFKNTQVLTTFQYKDTSYTTEPGKK
jgi:CubicO group peptidase (beta-lactamase class C family)